MKKMQAIAVTSREGPQLHVALGVARLDIDTAPMAFRELDALLRRKVKVCRLDLSVVAEFTPPGLSLFPALAECCAERGIAIEWEHVPPALAVALKRQEGLRNLPRQSAHSIFDVAASLGYIGSLSLDFGRLTRETIGFLGELASALWQAIIAPHRIRWRETFYYMDVCGSDALPISALICFLMGFILAIQGALQLQQYGADVFLADGVGLSIVKELGPLMVAMICTGRAGSAFAAEIGTMKVGEEIDALTTMGLVPSRFLVIPKLIAMVVVMPLLTLFGDVVGIIGGMTVAYLQLDIPMISYINRTVHAITPDILAESMSKSLVFAVIIALVGCLRGFQAGNDAQGVGRAATSAVVTSIFLLIIADTVITVLFNNLVYR